MVYTKQDKYGNCLEVLNEALKKIIALWAKAPLHVSASKKWK